MVTLSTGMTENEEKLSKSKNTLFKYTGIEYIESCIKNGVYASKIDEVNDPFESDGVKYPHLYRICCMTNSPKKMLLWSYYTNHKGCCVEFDVSSVDEKLLKKVEYYDSFSSHSNMSLDEIYTSLYHKGKEWQHENEYRAVYYERKKDSSAWNYSDSLVFLNVPVKSVTFGLFADRDLEKYKNALEVLIKYGIDAKKCRLKNNRYALEDDPQFDLQIELEKTKEKLLQTIENALRPKLDSDELHVLKIIAGLQTKDSIWVPFKLLTHDKNMVLTIEALQNKGMLKMKTEEEDNSFQFYICISDTGLLYL